MMQSARFQKLLSSIDMDKVVIDKESSPRINFRVSNIALEEKKNSN
jgi:hypothetical protein